MCGPHWGPGGGPQRAKTMQISNIFFSRSSRRMVKLCSMQIPYWVKNKSCSWQFPGWPQQAPVGPVVKSNCFIFFLKMHGWILTQTWQESSLGAGDSKLFIWVHVAPMGGPGGGPQGPKLCKFQTSFSRSSLSRTVKLCKVQIAFQVKNKGCWWHFPGWPQWPPCGVTGWGGGHM